MSPTWFIEDFLSVTFDGEVKMDWEGVGEIIRSNVATRKNVIKVILNGRIVKEKKFVTHPSGITICIKSRGTHKNNDEEIIIDTECNPGYALHINKNIVYSL